LNQEEVNTRMEVGEKLGEGQYGTVYACTYKSRDGKSIEAAAKYLTHTRFSKKEHYQVLREANQMRLVQGHANIVNFYDLLMTPKEYRMIIELIKGGELYQKICQLNEASKIRGDHQHFSEERASKIVRQIMSAVAHMHSHKLIHRDLKPENVLLVEQVDGATLIDDFHIKVADFGLAFIADDPLGKAKGEAGTPLYMAPEVLKKASKGYTAEVDVWSIGCMMHELLTGEPPFMANDKMRLKRLVLGFKGMSGNSTLDPAAKKIRADFKKDNVSATAQDLIIKLLNPKGKQRITASNAMEEPWLAKPAALGKANMMSTKKFHKNNHMAVLHKTKVHSQLTNADKYLDEVVDRHSTTKLLASVIRKDDATRMEDILAQLLDPDTDINTCDGNGVTPLMHALHKKDLEVVKMLVNAENLDGTSRINNWGMSKGHEYETALILAVRHGAPQQPGWRMVVKDMLEHRADPNQKATGGVVVMHP